MSHKQFQMISTSLRFNDLLTCPSWHEEDQLSAFHLGQVEPVSPTPKPEKYGLKVWRHQVYAGKAAGGAPEVGQGKWVTLDTIEGCFKGVPLNFSSLHLQPPPVGNKCPRSEQRTAAAMAVELQTTNAAPATATTRLTRRRSACRMCTGLKIMSSNTFTKCYSCICRKQQIFI